MDIVKPISVVNRNPFEKCRILGQECQRSFYITRIEMFKKYDTAGNRTPLLFNQKIEAYLDKIIWNQGMSQFIRALVRKCECGQ